VLETGSGSCPVVGFGISGVEPLASVTREIANELDAISCGVSGVFVCSVVENS
jgi:hypothetical protein